MWSYCHGKGDVMSRFKEESTSNRRHVVPDDRRIAVGVRCEDEAWLTDERQSSSHQCSILFDSDPSQNRPSYESPEATSIMKSGVLPHNQRSQI